MTDVSASDFAGLCFREADTRSAARRQAPPRKSAVAIRRGTARPQAAQADNLAEPLAEVLPEVLPEVLEEVLAETGRAEPHANMADSVLEWLRQTPGHWRGRAFARRELASTACHDAEQREHLAMADLYDRLSLTREAMSPLLPSLTEVDRWRWRPEAATAIPADHAAEDVRRRLTKPGR